MIDTIGFDNPGITVTPYHLIPVTDKQTVFYVPDRTMVFFAMAAECCRKACGRKPDIDSIGLTVPLHLCMCLTDFADNTIGNIIICLQCFCR